MKLLLCDEYKINTYQLPDKVEDFFIINDSFGKTSSKETIYLDAYQNNWSIRSDNTITIQSNGQYVARATLTEYASYELKFSDLETLFSIFIIPDFENYSSFVFNKSFNITIGNSNQDNIFYQITTISSNSLTIANINNHYVIRENTKYNNLYINSKKTKQSILKIGDVIFYKGLKIIWMETFIKINNPKNLVSIHNLSSMMEDISDNTYTETTDFEKNIKLYDDNKIFFHTPRLKPEVKKEIIKIESPPDEERNEQMPMILTIGSSAIIGITSCLTGISALNDFISGNISTFNAVLELSMCILMLVACVLLPILTDLWQKNRIVKKEKLRQKRYKEYLNKKRNEISEIMKQHEQILYENNLNLKEIETAIINHQNSIWSREIIDNDFLTLRLGIGKMPCSIKIEAPEEQFSLYDDNLKDEVNKMKEEKRLIENVPITISLLENRITPFIFNANYRKQYINSLLLQLIFYYSGVDLKLVVLTNSKNEKDWEYLKYLPHCWSKDREKRFFSTNENDMIQISMYLEQEYDRRIKELSNQDSEKKDEEISTEFPYKAFDEYYLLITDDFKEIKDLPIIDRIINSNVNFGFSIMILESSLKNLPSRFDKFVSIDDTTCGILERTLDKDKQIQFQPEYQPDLNINAYSKILANIPVSAKNQKQGIPISLSFLEMYKVGQVNQLNILTRWKDNNPTISLRAPIGMKEYEKLLDLDLHEKFHGPHGLIAGSTGSGKSEFIMTYILSMAINYHPDEVQFILIDYKGGGLALAFENRETKVQIPHLVGTITNLDNNEIHRALVSIRSELKRRQVKFNEARNLLGEGTIDIYKYQRLYREGKVKEPISHLFVIADEFAELKAQEPDFMNELVSTARIGRSLGVHLILATQKPSGVVDDQIWSNSRFHVCLKVQTVEDSMEMLKKPDAANIKEVGRLYLQVGNDELFEFGQSAWAGASYIPVNRLVKKIDDDIEFVNNDGSTIKRINNAPEVYETIEYGEQLTNIVNYLYELAKREKINFHSLWLPSIPTEIYLSNIIKKYSYKSPSNKIEVLIGEYDKPQKQEQGPCTIDLICKNTLIFGLPGSGKENLLSTIIYTSCICYSPKLLQFHILDFGSESLSIFNKMPHIGSFILAEETEKIEAYFEYLTKEIKKRKELFSEYSGDYMNYCKNSGSSVPTIVTILNGFESYMENCGQLNDYLIHLLREGSKYGIIFITTAVSTNSIRSSLLDCFTNKIILQIADEFDYRYILDAPQGLIPKKTFGRGMMIIEDEACEFQTAYITEKDHINSLIKSTGKQLFQKFQYKVKEIKLFPKIVSFKTMLPYMKEISKVPLGISRDDVDITYFDFTKNKINLILGEKIIDDLIFMCGIIDLIDSIKNIRLNILDFLSCIETDGNAHYYNVDFKSALNNIIGNEEKTTINIFIGLGNFKNVMSTDEIELFNQIMESPNNLANQFFIIIDNYNRFSNLKQESWYSKLNKNYGVWYGENIDDQDVFEINSLKEYDVEEKLTDVAYIIEDGKYTVIRGIGKDSEELL